LNEELKAREPKQSGVLTATADVTNTGSRAGVETVQCYLRFQGTSVAQPVRALSGFQRITLAPGETKKVTFQLGPEALALWNDQQKFAAEPAKVTLWIAPDSSQGLQATLEITK
jgi:beta-glucosidase